MDIVSPLLNFGSALIDKLFPNPAEKAKAQAILLQMQQEGEIKQIQTQLTAIVVEANSQDKWTSRARPSFLYVMYVMILAALPMGALYAFNPELAANIAEGLKEWLGAIPDTLWALFGTGYLGYSFSRSYDKGKILQGKQ